MNLNKGFRNVKMWTKKHSPELLTTLGIGCFAAGAILTVPATVKALDLIEEEKDRRLEEWPHEIISADEEAELLHFTPMEYVKTCWKVYSPSALLAFLGGVCVINANRINIKRTAALTAAYTISETALREFKEKAVEVVGENKVETIKQKVAEERIAKNPPIQSEVIVTGRGETLCRESAITGRYFEINLDMIQKIENEINLIMRNQDYCGFNVYLDKLGLEHTKISGALGWNVNKDGYIKIERIPALTPEGEPCISLEFDALPHDEYNMYY